MSQSCALASAVSPSQPVREFPTYQYVAFFCQMTLFNGLRRFPYVYLPCVSLGHRVLTAFKPLMLHCKSTPFHHSRSHFGSSCHTCSPSYSPAHPPPILPFPVPRSTCASFSHVDCKLLEDPLLGWKHSGPSLVNERCINAVEKVYCRENGDDTGWRLRKDGICLFPWLAQLN